MAFRLPQFQAKLFPKLRNTLSSKAKEFGSEYKKNVSEGVSGALKTFGQTAETAGKTMGELAGGMVKRVPKVASSIAQAPRQFIPQSLLNGKASEDKTFTIPDKIPFIGGDKITTYQQDLKKELDTGKMNIAGKELNITPGQAFAKQAFTMGLDVASIGKVMEAISGLMGGAKPTQITTKGIQKALANEKGGITVKQPILTNQTAQHSLDDISRQVNGHLTGSTNLGADRAAHPLATKIANLKLPKDITPNQLSKLILDTAKGSDKATMEIVKQATANRINQFTAAVNDPDLAGFFKSTTDPRKHLMDSIKDIEKIKGVKILQSPSASVSSAAKSSLEDTASAATLASLPPSGFLRRREIESDDTKLLDNLFSRGQRLEGNTGGVFEKISDSVIGNIKDIPQKAKELGKNILALTDTPNFNERISNIDKFFERSEKEIKELPGEIKEKIKDVASFASDAGDTIMDFAGNVLKKASNLFLSKEAKALLPGYKMMYKAFQNPFTNLYEFNTQMIKEDVYPSSSWMEDPPWDLNPPVESSEKIDNKDIYDINDYGIVVNDRYQKYPTSINVPAVGKYRVSIESKTDGSEQMREEYRLQMNDSEIGPVIEDTDNENDFESKKITDHGIFNLDAGTNIVNFYAGGQLDRKIADYNERGSVHFNRIFLERIDEEPEFTPVNVNHGHSARDISLWWEDDENVKEWKVFKNINLPYNGDNEDEIKEKLKIRGSSKVEDDNKLLEINTVRRSDGSAIFNDRDVFSTDRYRPKITDDDLSPWNTYQIIGFDEDGNIIKKSTYVNEYSYAYSSPTWEEL